jgi:hypothetical protein
LVPTAVAKAEPARMNVASHFFGLWLKFDALHSSRTNLSQSKKNTWYVTEYSVIVLVVALSLVS